MQQMPYSPNPYQPLSPAMGGGGPFGSNPFAGGGSVFGFAQQQQAPADPYASYEYGVRGSIDSLRRSNTLNRSQLREVDAAEAELKQMMDLRRNIQARLKPFMQNMAARNMSR